MLRLTDPRRPPARRPGRAGAALGLTVLVLTDAAALAVLVPLGRQRPFDLPLDTSAWARAEPADALAAALRWVALGAAGWLLLATLASLASAVAAPDHARMRRRPLIARMVPRALRLLAEQAVVGGLALGVAALPAAAQAARRQDAPVVTVVRDGRAADLASLPSVESTTTSEPLRATTTPTVRSAAEPGVADTPSLPTRPEVERVVTVAPGEHLWELAAREVARIRGVPREAVLDADVAPYWIAVCDANRARLASGDVNVVEVGETVVLPPVA